MADQHPIIPSFEMANQWHKEACKDPYNGGRFIESKTLKYIATKAAQWGADQQLEVCVEWLGDAPVVWIPNEVMHPGTYLREACRPKPPSLKERALTALQFVDEKLDLPLHNHCNAIHTIRTALEALPNE
jgi:hypothetical protein